jgi:hypothetical protein
MMETSTKNIALEKIELTNDIIILEERVNPAKWPTYTHCVRHIRKTPKGKYLKEKTLTNYVYRNYQEASNAAVQLALSITNREQRRLAYNKEKREKNKNTKASDYYQLGDIIVNTWGYEQTNVSFYQAIKITNRTITVKEIASTTVPETTGSMGMSCDVLPKIDGFTANGKEYKLIVYSEGRLSNPTSYYYFHKWDGRPMYSSWYA